MLRALPGVRRICPSCDDSFLSGDIWEGCVISGSVANTGAVAFTAVSVVEAGGGAGGNSEIPTLSGRDVDWDGSSEAVGKPKENPKSIALVLRDLLDSHSVSKIGVWVNSSRGSGW